MACTGKFPIKKPKSKYLMRHHPSKTVPDVPSEAVDQVKEGLNEMLAQQTAANAQE